MIGPDYVVAPLAWTDIGRVADGVRVQFSLYADPEFPVMEFIEKVLDQRLGVLRLEVLDEAEMGDYEGLTDPKGEFMCLRLDVYEKGWARDGRARFTAAHELGHFFLHTNIPMARASPERHVVAYRRCEPQANQFAAELLMPRHFMRPDDTVQRVADRHRVSLEAARNRIDYMQKSVWRI
jgi:Zn-dependent peptidase ImmA (M78 family)